jgi:hypothetical protein
MAINIVGQDSSVSIATRYEMEAKFSASVQTGPEAHSGSCTMGTGPDRFPEGKASFTRSDFRPTGRQVPIIAGKSNGTQECAGAFSQPGRLAGRKKKTECVNVSISNTFTTVDSAIGRRVSIQ